MSFYTFTAVAALVGAVSSMIIGVIWYGPLFGKKWGKVIGMPTSENLSKAEMIAMQKGLIPTYLTNFAALFVQYFALGFFAILIGGLTLSGAALYAVFVWIGFVVPVLAVTALWSGKSKKDSWMMFGLTTGYQLVSLVIGAILWAFLYTNLG